MPRVFRRNCPVTDTKTRIREKNLGELIRIQYEYIYHWEIKGRFRKRVVLANVPSFRFSFRGNIRRNLPFGNHPFVNTKKGYWEMKGRFPKGWFWRTYPRSGFRSGGTSAETTLLETTLLRTPEYTSIKSQEFKMCLFPLGWYQPAPKHHTKECSHYYWGQNDYMPKNCFEQLIFELHRITVHPFLFARINFRL